MKKSFIFLFSILIIASACCCANAKSGNGSALSSAIRTYKSGNYAQAYTEFSNIAKKDPSNAVAYYYLAISAAQIGKRDEAIENYDKVLSLSNNWKLVRYAKKGKVCIESPSKCNEPDADESELDRFVRSHFGTGFSKEVQSDFERQKIQNIMREMNRKDDIPASEFKEYRDFSTQAPTNDEIVSALRTLQRAGLNNVLGGYNSDLSMLYNNSNDSTQMLNMLTGNGTSNLSPQVIQTLLTNQLTGGF